MNRSRKCIPIVLIIEKEAAMIMVEMPQTNIITKEQGGEVVNESGL